MAKVGEFLIPDRIGKTFVVSGACSGVGLATSRYLAGLGARVILACRSAEGIEFAMAAIRAEHPAAELDFVLLDLRDLASVREAASGLSEKGPVDVLINNAGAIYAPLFRTEQGFEGHFGVNHLAHFALTLLMLPTLSRREGARIVTVSSNGYKRARSLTFDDVTAGGPGRFDGRARYYASKLANLLFTIELDRRLRLAGCPAISVGCHPGAVTTVLNHVRGPAKAAISVLAPLLNTPEQGAAALVAAAAGSGVMGGDYIGPRGTAGLRGEPARLPLRDRAGMVDAAGALWEQSERLTGLLARF